MNNKKISIVLFFGILMISILYLTSLAYIICHESIHKTIFEGYNINSTIKINYFTLSGVTTPLNNYKNCGDFCLLSHALNDITGYYFSIFIMTLWFIVIVIGIYELLIKYE